MDPHRVLGVAPNASQADIKRAYRRLAKALHPDAAGEAALPRFLELQDAYELLTGTKVRTVRPPGAGPGRGPSGGARPAGGSQGAPGFQEPWRADPARARAAREQARTRQGWSGAGAPPGPEGSTGPARRSGGAPGAGSRGGSSGPTMGSGRTTTSSASGSAPRGRRRPSRKATLGSTSYDEAREPADRAWAGASWYGPTTGEYWHINP
ncbi:MAG TPA: J domain-containing protein, partial [Candidatus Binatus sp.]|nr:J domain-containing protein [Candidatus Binatus sp.]